VKTALDSSVLLDVLGADRVHGERSREALRTAYEAGALVACDVVWAEVRAHFPSDESFREAIGTLGVQFEPISADAAALAGSLWKENRRGPGAGRGRERVVADFLIGGHARQQADALLSRDRGFYRRYFKDLTLIDPSRPR
jgi:predicted nucleic acid-binding protein